MNTPIIALDVDGVFSPILKDEDLENDNYYRWDQIYKVWPWDPESNDEFPLVKTNAMAAYVARPVADFFRNVHASGRARVMWHSTWGENAKQFETELDLPSFDVLYELYSNHGASERWQKLVDVEALLAQGERVIWLDDHIPDAAQGDPILDHPNLFWIAPGPGDTVGLSRSDLAVIDKVLNFWA